jgi:hypothetical protein
VGLEDDMESGVNSRERNKKIHPKGVSLTKENDTIFPK